MIRDRIHEFIVASLVTAFAISPAHAAHLTVNAPAQSTVEAGQFTLTGNASGFLNVEVWYDGTEIARAIPDSAGAFSMQVNASSIPAGAQTFIVHAWDSSPHTPFKVQARTPLTITVSQGSSGTAPAVPSNLTVTSPSNGADVSGQVSLSGSAPGMTNVEISHQGILLARASPDSSGAYSATFSTLVLPDGPQTLTVNGWNSPAGQAFTRTAGSTVDVVVANRAVNILDYGAVADGVTDNFDAINASIAAAQAAGVSVFVPAGTFAYGNVLRLRGVKMFGVGDVSVLYALNWAYESIFMYGSGAQVRQLKLAGVTAPARVAPWEATRITLFGASNFVIDHLTIVGSAAGGIQTAMGANNGVISNNSISNTLADSIHLTDSASHIVVENNIVQFSGDDGIAVVSYLQDGARSNNIRAINNVVRNNLGGRSMSVVGGDSVTYENNLLENNAQAAGFYFAQESSWNTFGDTNVVARGNTVISCGNPSLGHGAVMIITTGTGQNNGVQLIDNDIEQSGQAGVRVFGSNYNVVLSDNAVSGASPPWDIQDPGVNFTQYQSGAVGRLAPVSLPTP